MLTGLQDVPMREFETWLDEEKFDQAERQARAIITRYGCWIRQHIPMFSDKSNGTYNDEMISVDCSALAECFLQLERWASWTKNEEAVTDAYRRRLPADSWLWVQIGCSRMERWNMVCLSLVGSANRLR